MSKKVIAIITAVALMLTMIVPAMAGGGDNTGDDDFPCSITISNSTLIGAYTLGTEKIFNVSTYASSSAGTIVNRKIEVTKDSQTLPLQFLDGDIWKDIGEYNVQVALENDVSRQIKIVFNEEGIYTINFSLSNDKGEVLITSKRVVQVSEGEIALYIEPETTTEEATTASPETTTEEKTTASPETTTEEKTTVSPETTTEEKTTASPETTTEEKTTVSPEITTEENTTVLPETTTEESTTALSETTTEEKTTAAPETTTAPAETTTVKAPARVKISKVKAKKKSSKQVKISLKKIKGVRGYQVAVYSIKKNAKKNKRPLVRKLVKKAKITLKSKRLKNKKKLFVKARAYVKDANGKTIWGKWSKIKTVKIIK